MYNWEVSGKRWHNIWGFFLLIGGGLLLAWGLLPLPGAEQESKVDIPGRNEIDSEGSTTPYRLTLEWPAQLRKGDVEMIRMDLLPASVTGESEPGELPVDFGYNLLVESRLELDGVLHAPTEEILAPLPPGSRAEFVWSVQGKSAGGYTGKVWLHSQLVPREPGLQIQRSVISAPRLEIRIIELWGIGGPLARALGGSGIGLGVLLLIDPIQVIESGIWLLKRKLSAWRQNGL